MGLLDTILNAGGGTTIQRIGAQLGLDPQQTSSALSALIPAVAAGVHQNAQSEGGLASLMTALATGQHQQYVDNPATVGDAATIADGNAILGHVLGSKDASRQVATQAAAQTGIGADVLRQMLPMAATLVMGALAHHANQRSSSSSSSSWGGMLPQGSGMSSVLGMLGQFLGR